MRRKFKSPVRSGNRFSLIADGRVYLARMLDAVEQSQHYVLAEFYLVESGEVVDSFIAAVLRASTRGVQVRLLFDDLGSRGLTERDRARLRGAGLRVAFYNVMRWRALARSLRRDHRKLLLVDGRVGFTGGAGLTDVFSPDARPDSYWQDCMVEMTGPVLTDWHDLLARTWQRCSHGRLDVIPVTSPAVSPGEAGRVVASEGLGRQELVYSVSRRVRAARRRVWIATPYFWPSIRLRRALRRVARRGLDVRLILAGSYTDAPLVRSVSRFFYAQLLASGVAIYEYRPRFLHCKVALCDEWVSIGSSNLDRWGALWNLDANQEIESPALAREAEMMLTQICADCTVLRDPSDVTHSWVAHVWRHIARVVFAWSMRSLSRLRHHESRDA